VQVAEEAEERRQTPQPAPTTLSSAVTEQEQLATSAQGSGKKPGRNQPCWCGSGKKFKNCHGTPTTSRT